MYSILTNRLIPVAKRFPRASGGMFLAMAAYFAYDGVKTGRKYEPFQDGVEVVGKIVEVRDSPGERPRFTADVAIDVGTAEPVIERVVLSPRYAHRVHEGDLVAMIRARDSSPRFVRKSDIKGQGLVKVAGRTVTGLFFVAIPIALFAIWFMVVGPTRFAEPPPRPAPPPAKRTIGSRPLPRPTQGAKVR